MTREEALKVAKPILFNTEMVRAILDGRKTVTRRINSIKEADLSDLKMPVVAVYEHPKDYPKHYIARIYDLDKPTDTIIKKDTLKEIQEDIKTNTNMIFLSRVLEDDECVVGMWM